MNHVEAHLTFLTVSLFVFLNIIELILLQVITLDVNVCYVQLFFKRKPMRCIQMYQYCLVTLFK